MEPVIGAAPSVGHGAAGVLPDAGDGTRDEPSPGLYEAAPGVALTLRQGGVVVVSGPGKEAADLRRILRRWGCRDVLRTASPEPSRIAGTEVAGAGLAVVVAGGESGLGPNLAIRAVEDLRAAGSDARILVLVGPGDRGLAVDALLAGASGCGWCPVEQEAVLEALEVLQSGGAPVPSDIVRVLLDRLHRDRRSAGTGGSVRSLLPLVEGLGPDHSPRARPGEVESAGAEAQELRALTRAERVVLAMLAAGWTDKRIAGQLGVSPRTVQTHNRNIFRKLGVTNRTQAAARLRPDGLNGHTMVA